jgi:CheY-like chemotaxis protein
MKNGKLIKILLVEDNAGDARLVREMLTDGGVSPSTVFDLTHVQRLNEALSSVNRNLFDIILLDLSLPDGQGLDTVDRMRNATLDIPIVVMSGLNDEAIAVKAVQTGAQDYLVKGHVDGYSLVRSLR